LVVFPNPTPAGQTQDLVVAKGSDHFRTSRGEPDLTGTPAQDASQVFGGRRAVTPEGKKTSSVKVQGWLNRSEERGSRAVLCLESHVILWISGWEAKKQPGTGFENLKYSRSHSGSV